MSYQQIADNLNISKTTAIKTNKHIIGNGINTKIKIPHKVLSDFLNMVYYKILAKPY